MVDIEDEKRMMSGSSSNKAENKDEMGKTGNSSSKTGEIEDERLHRSKTWTGTGGNGRKCLYESREWTCTSTRPGRDNYSPVGVVKASCLAFRADLRAEEARMRRIGPLTTAKVFMSSFRVSGEKLG